MGKDLEIKTIPRPLGRGSSFEEKLSQQNVPIDGGLKQDDGGINGGLKLSDSEIVVINEIKVNSFVKNEELVINTGLSSRTIDRCIKSLKEKGLITREGSKKTGRWVVRDESL